MYFKIKKAYSPMIQDTAPTHTIEKTGYKKSLVLIQRLLLFTRKKKEHVHGYSDI
jgi:hypothetical protein